MIRKHHTDDDGSIKGEEWRVFAVSKPKNGFVFEEDTMVLCQVCCVIKFMILCHDMNLITQDSKYYLEEFHVLKVDKNNVRMSEFIKTKLGSFETGKAFYEFKQPEDLSLYKEVVHVPVDIYNDVNRVKV